MAAPTSLEQLHLELVNSARLNPQQDAARYIASYAPLMSSDPDIQSALDFFDVNGTALQAAFAVLSPTRPLAWNDALGTAARTHSQLMVNADQQSHQLPGESGLSVRIEAAGYTGWSALAENIFAFAESALYGHAGFMVDWGDGPGTADGMQVPPGHRLSIMNPAYRELGVGVIEENNPATRVGPQVVTQDFGARAGGPAVFVLGVTYTDSDGNGFYSLGEGRGGMTVTSGSTQTTTAASGGYTLGLAAGSHTLTFAGGLLGAPTTFTATFGSGTNAKIDVVGGTTLLTSAGGIVSGPIIRIEVLGTIGISITGGAGAETIIGGPGNDTLNGSAGNDTLIGNAGNDAMHGGPGDDTFIVDAAGDTVSESAAEGTDTVIASVSFALSAHVEHLSLSGTSDLDATGNASSNVLTGNSGHNILTGGGGNDTLIGGDGFDTAQYAGQSTQYAFVLHESVLRVLDRVPGRDGVDALAQVEQARFIGDSVTAVFTASDVFTPLEYIASYDDLMTGFGANAQLGYEHFVSTGGFALRTASFDGLAYLASQPDLIAGLAMNNDLAATHFIQSGRFEGRSISFNGLEYIASYNDLINSFGVNEDLGTNHYLSAGRFEGRAVSFSGLEYLAANPDLMAGFGTNFEQATIHYIASGRFEGRTADFDALQYIASYADLIQGIANNRDAGSLHYINAGRFEGRSVTFNPAQYLANYADLAAGFGNNHDLAIEHFINTGFYEGRTDQPPL